MPHFWALLQTVGSGFISLPSWAAQVCKIGALSTAHRLSNCPRMWHLTVDYCICVYRTITNGWWCVHIYIHQPTQHTTSKEARHRGQRSMTWKCIIAFRSSTLGLKVPWEVGFSRRDAAPRVCMSYKAKLHNECITHAVLKHLHPTTLHLHSSGHVISFPAPLKNE